VERGYHGLKWSSTARAPEKSAISLRTPKGISRSNCCLPPKYDLMVRAAGFEPFVLNGVQVQITEVSRLKIQLVLSGAKEQIAIGQGSVPSNRERHPGTSHRSKHDRRIALVNRNFAEILGLTAGILDRSESIRIASRARNPLRTTRRIISPMPTLAR
jgi:hypothetical protein